ncbi:Hypothetical protein NTJ_13058 [Nesidiocoris tenuis]|uniref:Uncharacterized protein n=1 Tax=Nesidiocoris tenuis TaxID=355587 RepID=A0ABN7B768_9HEMI|nr:Hypothetical protein NTJ_13058 [Nesidiocoris tenuis]
MITGRWRKMYYRSLEPPGGSRGRTMLERGVGGGEAAHSPLRSRHSSFRRANGGLLLLALILAKSEIQNQIPQDSPLQYEVLMMVLVIIPVQFPSRHAKNFI